MLTETQIDIIEMLASAILLGLLTGLAGLLTGALIQAMRARRAMNYIPVALQGALPSVGFSTLTSLLIVVIQMAVCKPGHKSGWDVPDWAVAMQAMINFVAGIVGCLVAPCLLSKISRWKKVFALALVAAVLGAIANLDTAFDGYYVLNSNVRPIHQAMIGFVVGGIAVLLWRMLIRMQRDVRAQKMPSA